MERVDEFTGGLGTSFFWTIIYIFREVVARGIISRAKLGDLQKRDPRRISRSV